MASHLRLLGRAGPDGKAIVYFAGHAYKDERGQIYLAPKNFDLKRISGSGLSLQWLVDQFEQCAAKEKLLLLDCSHAGEGAEGQLQPSTAEMVRSLRALPGRGPLRTVTAVTSCAEGQRGQDLPAKEQGLFRTDETPDPEFTDTAELDLGTVEPSLAGPKRPQDRVKLQSMRDSFRKTLTAPVKQRGFGLESADLSRTVQVAFDGTRKTLGHGSVVIAAITSCTNTSNPSVVIAAGLLAKKATARGLRVPPYVKTSLAP